MKKLAAILLIALFLFNLCGYRILFYSVLQQSDARIEKSLDKNQYDEKDLITITIPISVPYQNSWSDFERFDGEVNFHGKIYKYVKRKVSEGNLILLCLPDNNKTRLENVKNDLLRDAGDLQVSNSQKLNHSKFNVEKNLSHDYYQSVNDYSLSLVIYPGKVHYFDTGSSLVSAFYHCPDRPPEAA